MHAMSWHREAPSLADAVSIPTLFYNLITMQTTVATNVAVARGQIRPVAVAMPNGSKMIGAKVQYGTWYL